MLLIVCLKDNLSNEVKYWEKNVRLLEHDQWEVVLQVIQEC